MKVMFESMCATIVDAFVQRARACTGRMSPARASIEIEVAYALPGRAIVKAIGWPTPATLEDALRCRRWRPRFRGLDLAAAAVGVYGQVARPTRAP